MAKKIYVIGIDQMILPLTRILVDEGALPNIKGLIDKGASNQALSCFPAWTPTNWATISTGAETGTHGVFSWLTDLGEGKTVSPFHSLAVNAETIWEVAERQGIKSALIHYPASMPSRLKEGYVVDGDATPEYGGSRYEITPSGCYTNISDIPGTEQIHLKPAQGWKSLPPSNSQPLEAEIRIIPKFVGEEKTLHLLITDSSGRGYDRAAVCRQRDYDSKVVETEEGKWSPWAREEFVMEGRGRTGTLRFKLIELSKDAERVRLYRSQVMPLDGFTEPEEIGTELVEKFGPYIEHVSEFSYILGAIDLETCLEEAEYQAQWFAKAARYLVREKGCRLFMSHWHFLDDINHHHLAQIDPSWSRYDPDKAKHHWELVRKVYRIIDRMVGTIMEDADDETYVVLISDHGNEPINRVVHMEQFLHDRGLLKMKDESMRVSVYDEAWMENIDWKKTKVFMKPGPYEDPSNFYINAEGEEYEKVRKELIRHLRTWVDEETGDTPIAIALKKEDAAVLGLWGDCVGDVVVILEKGYNSFTLSHELTGDKAVHPIRGVLTASHGLQLLTAQSKVSSHLALFILYGPGIKAGYQRPADKLGYIRLVDVTPTLCHILGIEPPRQSQGKVAKDLFEGYDMVRTRPDVEVEERPIDKRAMRQERGMHDYNILKKFPWE